MTLALPLTLELTSAAAALASVILIAIAVRVALEPQPWWRRLAVLAVGSLAYSGVHIALMTLFRMTLFKAAGGDYDFSFSEVPYEYRKDLLAFVIIGVMFWLLSRRQARPRRLAVPRATPRRRPSTSATAPRSCAWRRARSSPPGPPATTSSSRWRTAAGR